MSKKGKKCKDIRIDIKKDIRKQGLENWRQWKVDLKQWKVRLGILCALLLCQLFFNTQKLSVCAKEPQMPPHLVQSVSDKEIWESMISLGLTKCVVLQENNCEKAYENVKNCVVELHMGNAYGSGVIWEITPEAIVIATNKHVLDFWEEEESYIIFAQGYSAQAKLIGVSDRYDVGFVQVDCGKVGDVAPDYGSLDNATSDCGSLDDDALDYGKLITLRQVSKEKEAYEQLQADDAIFYVGAGREETEGFFLGSVGEKQCYIPEFGEEMIYGYGYARSGMSGGGTFDAKGRLVGMISGGTKESETASVPLCAMWEAYESICPNS